MMWKQGSSADELFEGMQQAELDAVAKEEQQENHLVFEALNELNAAAQSFEGSGRVARAKEVTAVMMSLAKDEDRKKSKKDKTSKEDEVKKVFMFFGFGPDDLEGLNLSGAESDGDGD